MNKLLLALCISLSLTSCLYSNIRFPLDEDLWETRLGHKVGVASNYSILWLVAWGDAGVKAAAEQGGITKINHMDMAVKTVLFGVYFRRDTIVYGE
jgi:TRL-like protein family